DDLARVRIDGRRLLADRELDTRAIEDRPAARGDRDRLAVLPLGRASKRGRLDALQPRGARQRRGEDENEDREEQADAPVGLLLGLHFARSTYPYPDGSWYCSPNCRPACVSMRPARSLLESSDRSAAFSARSLTRSEFTPSSARFRRSTATFTNTTPARRIPLTAIQRIPPPAPARCSR